MKRLYLLAGVLAVFGRLVPGAAAAPVTVLSSCTDIQRSGSYTLDRDITGSVGLACLQIRDVSDVQLDCHGHSVTTDGASLSAILVQAAKNFTVTGCRIPQVTGFSMFVGNTLGGTITKNKLKDMFVNEPLPAGAAALRIVDNEFSEGGPPIPNTHPAVDGGTGVVPVAEGINWMLARYLAVPTVLDEAGPSGRPLTASVASPVVYPNPWRADRHASAPITFGGLTGHTTIEIFTLSAHSIKTIHTSATSETWDLRNASGDRVASGLYLYLIRDDQNHKFTGQISVIR